MIVVYFEEGVYAEIAAIFRDDNMYIKCLPELEKQAEIEGFRITEAEHTEEEVIEILTKP